MWIALHINCFTGDFIPVGPFSNEAEAKEFCRAQDQPKLWTTREVLNPANQVSIHQS